MSIEELQALKGRKGLLNGGRGGLPTQIEIVDVKQAYGRDRVLVRTPGAEAEGKWVNLNRVELDKINDLQPAA